MFSKRKLVIFSSLLFFLFVFIGASSAATVNVNPGTDAIKKAVTNANSGDTLKLSAGTYSESNIQVNKNLIITGPVTSGNPTAIVDAQNKGRVFKIPSGVTVTLKYLIIKNGDARKDTSKMDGGGIQNGNSNLIVDHCKFLTNNGNYGGAIYNAYSGNVKLSYSTLQGNHADTSGGAICNDHGGTFTINKTTSSYNTASTYGGGIYNNDNSKCTVNSSTITKNTASYGGGVYNGAQSVFTVYDSMINYNTATSTMGTGGGSGIYNYSGGKLNITRTAINFNSGWYGQIAYGSGEMTNVSIYGSWRNPGWKFETVDSPGFVGEVTSLVMDGNNNPHILYYDYYGSYWKYAYKINGIWYKEFIDKAIGDKWYAYKTSANSLVLDKLGNPRVLYQSPNGLKYAYKKNGKWYTEIVDSDGGKYTSIALDTEGNPHISYESLADPYNGQIVYRLRTSVGWSEKIAVGGGLPNTCPTTIQVDKNNNAHIAYFGSTSTDGQHTGLCYASQGLSSGAWRNEFIVLHNVLMPSSENRNIYLALDSNGNPHITCGYLQSDGWRFAYIYKEDSPWNPIWHIDVLNDVAHSDAGFFGLYNSLVLDSKGQPHICIDFTKYDSGAYGESSLRYLTKNANGQWNEPVIVETFPTLASSTMPEGMRSIGRWCSLALDSNGNPCISYFDDLNKNLIYAYIPEKILPTVKTTDPVNGSTKVVRNKTIKITFSENIKAGPNYSKITLKSSNGTTITITKSISGNILTIKHSALLAANTKYIITLYSGCVTDLAGNALAARTFTFTTGST